jgi:transcription elongation factor Elf1
MHCPYCGTPNGVLTEQMQTHYIRVDCKWCGAEMLVSIEVQRPPDLRAITGMQQHAERTS